MPADRAPVIANSPQKKALPHSQSKLRSIRVLGIRHKYRDSQRVDLPACIYAQPDPSSDDFFRCLMAVTAITGGDLWGMTAGSRNFLADGHSAIRMLFKASLVSLGHRQFKA